MVIDMKINLQWLWRHVPRFELVLLALFAFPGSFEQVANGWTFGQIPAMVAAQARVRWLFVLIAVGLYVGTYVFSFGFQFLMQDVIRRANIALKSTMLRGSFASGEDQNVGLNRMAGDAVKIQDQYFNVIAAIITAACTAIACAWLVFTSNWQLGLIKIAFSFLAMLPMAFGAKFMARLGQRWSSANAQTVSAAKDWLAGRVDVIQYRAQDTFFSRVFGALKVSEKRQQQQSNGQLLMWTISALFAVISFFVPLVLGFWFLQHGLFAVTASNLIVIMMTGDSISYNVRAVVQYWSQIAGTRELRQLPEVPDVRVASADLQDSSVALNQVALSFGDQTILQPTTLRFAGGSKSLISGPSGSGKSSLLSLLSGWRQPTAGQVQVGAQPATPTSVTYITQQPWLFHGTVRDNLTLGQDFTDAQLQSVLADVGLDDELGADPLTRTVDPQQNELSGGQLQRLMIARGLLRKRPVLLLDEITAGLDDANAASIRDLLYHLPNTVVEVAHHYDPQQLAACHVQHLQLTADHTLA